MSNEVVLSQNNIVSLNRWSDLQARAEYLAKSELVPVALRQKPANVAIILQIGCELGISPMQAINGVTVVQGRPGVDPQLALALIRRDVPGSVIKIETCEESGKEMARVFMARSKDLMEEGYAATWTMAKAKQMLLTEKDNYKKQPLTMLRWRAAMEAARVIFPDVIRGMYSPDELDGLPMDIGPGTTPDTDKAAALNAKISAAKEVLVEVADVDRNSNPEAPAAAEKLEQGSFAAFHEGPPPVGGASKPPMTKKQLAVLIKDMGVKLGLDMAAIHQRCIRDFNKTAPQMNHEEMWELAQQLDNEVAAKEAV